MKRHWIAYINSGVPAHPKTIILEASYLFEVVAILRTMNIHVLNKRKYIRRIAAGRLRIQYTDSQLNGLVLDGEDVTAENIDRIRRFSASICWRPR